MCHLHLTHKLHHPLTNFTICPCPASSTITSQKCATCIWHTNFTIHLPISQFVPAQPLAQSHLKNVPPASDTQTSPSTYQFHSLSQPGHRHNHISKMCHLHLTHKLHHPLTNFTVCPCLAIGTITSQKCATCIWHTNFTIHLQISQFVPAQPVAQSHLKNVPPASDTQTSPSTYQFHSLFLPGYRHNHISKMCHLHLTHKLHHPLTNFTVCPCLAIGTITSQKCATCIWHTNFTIHLPISQFVPAQPLAQSHLNNVPPALDTQTPPSTDQCHSLSPPSHWHNYISPVFYSKHHYQLTNFAVYPSPAKGTITSQKRATCIWPTNFTIHLPISQFVPAQPLAQSHLKNVPPASDTQTSPSTYQCHSLSQPVHRQNHISKMCHLHLTHKLHHPLTNFTVYPSLAIGTITSQKCATCIWHTNFTIHLPISQFVPAWP